MSHWYYIAPEDYRSAEQIGVHARMVYERVYRYGWTVTDAVNTPPKVGSGSLSKWRDICQQNGIKWTTFNKRRRRGWSCEKAAMTPLNVTQPKYSAELIAQAKANGVSYNTFLHRVNASGWTPEAAAAMPLIPQTERSKCAIGPQRPRLFHPWKLANRFVYMNRAEYRYIRHGQRY